MPYTGQQQTTVLLLDPLHNGPLWQRTQWTPDAVFLSDVSTKERGSPRDKRRRTTSRDSTRSHAAKISRPRTAAAAASKANRQADRQATVLGERKMGGKGEKEPAAAADRRSCYRPRGPAEYAALLAPGIEASPKRGRCPPCLLSVAAAAAAAQGERGMHHQALQSINQSLSPLRAAAKSAAATARADTRGGQSARLSFDLPKRESTNLPTA